VHGSGSSERGPRSRRKGRSRASDDDAARVALRDLWQLTPLTDPWNGEYREVPRPASHVDPSSSGNHDMPEESDL